MANILVVDDHQPMRQLICLLLESAGHTVVEAFNGHEARHKLQGEKFDLLITDILMPECDGIEIIMDLQRDQKDLPVIAITGMVTDSELYLKVAKSLGAKATLVKPFSEKELFAATNEALTGFNEIQASRRTREGSALL